jgi:hypothetical protein
VTQGLSLAIDLAFLSNYTETVAQAIASAFSNAGSLAGIYDEAFDGLAANGMECPGLAAVIARKWRGRSHQPYYDCCRAWDKKRGPPAVSSDFSWGAVHLRSSSMSRRA